MSWVIITLASAAINGIVNILDKTVLFRYVQSYMTVTFLIGAAQGVIGIILVIVLSWPEDSIIDSVGWAFFSGVLLALGGIILMGVLYSQEVSRTVPIYQSFPIFAALIAVFFLDESLASYHWVGIVATVFGAGLLSVRQDQEYHRLFLHRSFFILITGSIIASVSYIASKIALEELPVLNIRAPFLASSSAS